MTELYGIVEIVDGKEKTIAVLANQEDANKNLANLKFARILKDLGITQDEFNKKLEMIDTYKVKKFKLVEA